MPPAVPADLVYYLRRGRCVLFAGSGLSAWAALPTWKSLLERLTAATSARLPDRQGLAEEMNRLLEAKKYLEVADYCKDKLGEHQYDQVLAQHLVTDNAEVPEAHRLIAQLPFAAVVTTNYDRLLETASAQTGRGWPKTLTQLDLDPLALLLFAETFFILKAHGDIDRPESLVLTTRDYARLIHENAAFNAMLSTMLLTKAILFIGYSLTDLDFRLLFERQLSTFRGQVPVRYSLMTNVSSVEADVLFRSTGVKVLPYSEKDGHREALLFLRNLHRAASDTRRRAPPPPAKRSAAASPPARPSSIPASTQVLSIRLQGHAIEATLSWGDVPAFRGLKPLADWPGLTQRLVRALDPSGSGLAKGFRGAGIQVASCLPPEILRALGRLPPDQLLVLRLQPELEPLPWELAWVKGEHLCRRHPVIRAPIGITDQARGYPAVHRPIQALLIGDPSEDLRASFEEVQQIAEAYRRSRAGACKVLARRSADFDSVVRHLLAGRYDVVHFTGRAHYDEQEGFLALYKFALLRASELRALLHRQPPAVLILNCPYTAFVPPDVPASASTDWQLSLTPAVTGGKLSFTEVASTAGVGVFVGCFGSTSDPGGAQVALYLHEELLSGTPAAVALYRARLRASKHAGLPDHSNALYMISGYPELALKTQCALV